MACSEFFEQSAPHWLLRSVTAIRPAIPFGLVALSADAEAELIARLRRGELSALGDAYDAHQKHVRAFAQRLLGDAAAAEDLLQDTFVALARAIHSFRGESSLRTLLISIAVNHARNHLRSAMRRRKAHERFSEEPQATSNLQDEVARRELAEALTTALDSLPIDQRVAIVLCEVEGRTSQEAAEIVGVPEGTIRTRIFHAKRKLKEALSQGGLR